MNVKVLTARWSTARARSAGERRYAGLWELMGGKTPGRWEGSDYWYWSDYEVHAVETAKRDGEGPWVVGLGVVRRAEAVSVGKRIGHAF